MKKRDQGGQRKEKTKDKVLHEIDNKITKHNM